MHSPGINGEGDLRGNWLTQVHLENGSVCVCVCVLLTVATDTTGRHNACGLRPRPVVWPGIWMRCTVCWHRPARYDGTYPRWQWCNW